MIETQIHISVNRKTDIDMIKNILIRNKIESPVYITEYGEHFAINFTSTYEEWELDKYICDAFPGYELTTDLHRGRKEIRLEVSRFQSKLCTTDWGYPIDDPLNETKYLIKKITDVPVQFNPEIKVLFGSDERTYHINIIPGINNSTHQKGFLLLKEFEKEADPETAEFFPDTLYETQLDAFYRGKDRLENVVDKDYAEYLAFKKKKKQQREKIPRKIVREFIKGCNNNDCDTIIKNISENLHFEIRKNWRQKLVVDGIEEFKNYVDCSYQEICSRDFKIKSSWLFRDDDIAINLETSLPPKESEEPIKGYYRIGMNFRLINENITQIIVEI
ncbi:hypothetical protein [Chryseobacterium defluvii]|uniref:Uncharacterized protein n=1 Tax=Chryseobacterium defluvii TaxID=160396 RepID=A0A495SP07_9FLAO|nr:hypothetical protein [Chryseobacterium defluvii]RKT01806.1 hypothetical protein BCF58_1031 [Chryseobacterium defluvii]